MKGNVLRSLKINCSPESFIVVTTHVFMKSLMWDVLTQFVNTETNSTQYAPNRKILKTPPTPQQELKIRTIFKPLEI